MPHKRAIFFGSLCGGVLLTSAAAFVWSQRLASERQERERHFIAIHFLAAEAAMEDGEDPKDFDGLLRSSGGRTSPLARPFPDGLLYRRNGSSFTLEEPEARRVSLLRTDRLLGSDRSWPRWESSGVPAKKFPEQQVPPSGYE
jgi:hypothetical protein